MATCYGSGDSARPIGTARRARAIGARFNGNPGIAVAGTLGGTTADFGNQQVSVGTTAEACFVDFDQQTDQTA